jgi:hypothetical protein
LEGAAVSVKCEQKLNGLEGRGRLCKRESK